MTKLSRSALASADITLINDNILQEIEPSDHRQSNQNIHDSFLSLVDDNIDKDADTSLKYLSNPTGAWDSNISHDLKLTPKVYVDDNFTLKTQLGSKDLSSNALSGIDGYVMYFNSSTQKYDIKDLNTVYTLKTQLASTNLGATALSPMTISDTGKILYFDGTNYDLVNRDTLLNTVVEVTGGTYNITQSDNNKIIIVKTSASAITTATFSSFSIGFRCTVIIRDVPFTLTPSGANIDGSVQIASNSGITSFQLIKADTTEFNTL